MSTIVVMPGGFHPFHAGHAALYNSARRAFPDAEVFVAATNDTSTRPFPFAIKEKLAKLAGVEPGHFVQVKSPFQAKEITAGFNPEVDRLIFVRSEKDASKPPQAGGVKKDGNPAYLQPLLGAKKLEPFAKHAYMAYLPTVEFGPGMTSATEIRTAWPQLNEKRKTALVMSLYPKTQGNPALAANVVKMLDTAMGSEELNEFAPGADNDRENDPEDVLFRFAKMWYSAPDVATQRRVEQALAKVGWEIGELESEEGGAFVMRVGDEAGNSYIGWSEEQLVGQLNEFAPDEGGGSRKFIPWPEFIEQVKQIVSKDFDCVENVVKTTIKARFVPHDPMEYGPTMLYSYYETRAGGRNKGAVSTRGAIQVGKYTGGGFTGQIEGKLLTTFSLLKGHPFERHFDLTFDNIYKIANIIMGNTQGALEFKPEGVAEGAASDDRPEHQLHTELVYNHGADKIKLQYERDGDTNKLIANIQKIAKLQHGMDIDADTAKWIAGDLVYPDILEQGVAEASALSGSPGTQGFVGGMHAAYQDRENQPTNEDYLDEGSIKLH